MLSGVLRSARAIQVNITIMGVFVRLRDTLALHKELVHKLAELDARSNATTPASARCSTPFTASPRHR